MFLDKEAKPASGVTTNQAILMQVGISVDSNENKWGLGLDHPDYTDLDAIAIFTDGDGREIDVEYVKSMRDNCNNPAWFDILFKEVIEARYAANCHDPVRLRKELLQVAASAVSWIKAIDAKKLEEKV
jgi:hypothetical protein